MKRCPRCGTTFQPARLDSRYCPPCHRDVTRIIEADTRRREPRFAVSKDLTSYHRRATA
jgi:uncharacterized OB-fold protein